MTSGFGCVVIGPAGSGKSTLCHVLQEVGAAQGRTYRVCNLDPAAEVFKYKCDIDLGQGDAQQDCRCWLVPGIVPPRTLQRDWLTRQEDALSRRRSGRGPHGNAHSIAVLQQKVL